MYRPKDKQRRILWILLTKENQGFTLTELLIALVISSIILTAAASGFVNLLRANQDVESKSSRSATLGRALAYMQEDIKQGSSVTAVTEATDPKCNTSGNSVESKHCLRITYPDDTDNNPSTKKYIYYAFDDIKNGSQIWLKPGVLRWKRIQENGTDSDWQAIADGLISVKEDDPTVGFNVPNGSAEPGDFCTQDSVNWMGKDYVYGDNGSGKGGFRFCLDKDPSQEESRLVRIFLYGHIIGGNGNNVIPVNTITFARSN